jgi:hypothetical protein
MALKKVTYFDKPGAAPRPETDDDQAKPNVYGVRWVNPDTFETIRVRGGARTGPHGEVLQEVDPTMDLTAFSMRELDKHSTLKK